MPSRQAFEQLYEADVQNQTLQSKQEYLTWVIRFYKGWDILPLGWEAIQGAVMAGIDEDHRSVSKAKLTYLGRLIANDWAKHNSVRHIDTKMLSVWGDVIQAAMEQGKGSATIDQITQDVLDLLRETLARQAVQTKRYQELLGLEVQSGELEI